MSVTHVDPSLFLDQPIPQQGLSVPALAPDMIHLWRSSVSRARISELVTLLDAKERALAGRFAFERDRARFVAARGMLRRLLGAYLQVPPSDVRFRHGPQGKPALAETHSGMDLRFNVSHSGNMALLAFGLGREVGVDVECIRNHADLEGVAQFSFSAEEQACLLACPIPLRLEMFLRYWTAKEAYVKTLGGGLSISLQDFTVVMDPAASQWAMKTSAGATLSAHGQWLPLPEGYVGAILAEGAEFGVACFDGGEEKRRIDRRHRERRQPDGDLPQAHRDGRRRAEDP